MFRVRTQVKSYMPRNMPRINSNIQALYGRLGHEMVLSAKRSIQKRTHRKRPAQKGSAPKNVTGKLKAGLDFKIANGVLWFGVKDAATSPPKGSRKRKNVIKWLETNHPFLRPAVKRVVSRIHQIAGKFFLTR